MYFFKMPNQVVLNASEFLGYVEDGPCCCTREESKGLHSQLTCGPLRSQVSKERGGERRPRQEAVRLPRKAP